MKRERRVVSAKNRSTTHDTRRAFDASFYKAYYRDTAEVPIDRLTIQAASGNLSAEHFYNPNEFLRHAIAHSLIPPEFDPVGYQINHPELWGQNHPPWEVALHYVRNGGPWSRPFDVDFYREVYFSEVTHHPADWLKAHHTKNPNTYGSLDEALFRNGWRSAAWTKVFDYQSYLVYNNLTGTYHSRQRALIHFIEVGWRKCMPISEGLEFDLEYYADLAGKPLHSVEEGYRTWVEQGLAAQAPANEAAHLRQLNLDIPRYPKVFNWQTYLGRHPDFVGLADARPPKPGRWEALSHFLENGVFTGDFSAVSPEGLSEFLHAVANRFVSLGKSQKATCLYERALLLANPSPTLVQHAADQAVRVGNPGRALGLYGTLRNSGHTTLWTYRNAADCAIGIGDLDNAVDWVLSGLACFPRDHGLRNQLLRIQQARYSRVMVMHQNALPDGQASKLVDNELDAIFELFLAARRSEYGHIVQRGPLQEDRPLRIVMLANNDLAQCSHYRVDLKHQQLRHAEGIELAVFDRSDIDDFCSAASTADLAIFYRLASSVEVLLAIATCRTLGIPAVYEIDDLVFDAHNFPEEHDAYCGSITEQEYRNLQFGVPLIRHAASLCDAGLASTEHLAAHLRTVVRSEHVLVQRNGLSETLSQVARSAVPRARKRGEGAPITLFYGSGTRAHGIDFLRILAPALDKLLAQHHAVRLVLCGHVEADGGLAKFGPRVRWVPPIEDREAYLAQLLDVDINLAVLRQSTFNDCKSEIKWLEAAAFGIPSVVSNVGGFLETLQDGVDVILAPPNPKAWYSLLQELIVDPDRRIDIGSAARRKAIELYHPSVIGQGLADGLIALAKRLNTDADPADNVPARPNLAVSVPRRPRVMLANVFYPPQAIGGATRVVFDQAKELVARHKQEFEVGVLCGNNEPVTPYQTEAYDWNGVRVWTISSPYQEHMDWFAFDPLMAGPIDAVFARFRPDLLHAHSIQRLTATLAERAIAHKIPYVITVHDAWWISDHQFLTDHRGWLRMPWDTEVYDSEFNRHTREVSLARRMKLRHILDNAAAILVVSEAFADICRRAGVSTVQVVQNAVPSLPSLCPSRQQPGRVRLAHLGGLTKMKGYHLLRNSVQRAQLRNTDLLAVDHSMLPNEERHEFWGTTPVRFVGLMPQDQIGKLYGQFDVLCAVSLWPESFGLVAHEALHYGKWVIVSGLGALADAIVPERNGWVVDVSDPEGLVQLLRKIDSSPEKFAHPSGFVTEERTVSAQTDEIVGVYRNILQRDHLAPLRPRPHNDLAMLPVNNDIVARRRTASRKSRAAAI